MSEPTPNPDRQFQIEVLGKLAVLQVGLERTQSRFDQLESRFEHLESRFDNLQARVEQMSETFTSQVSDLRLAQAETTANMVRLRVEVMARIDRLQESVELVREDARVTWATADTAMNRIKNYRDEIDRLTAMISAMERRHQTLASIVDGLRDRDAKRSNGS